MRTRAHALLVAWTALFFTTGATVMARPPYKGREPIPRFNYFSSANTDDSWTVRIELWQIRERLVSELREALGDIPLGDPAEPNLYREYQEVIGRCGKKSSLYEKAHCVVEWAGTQQEKYYQPEYGDRWATSLQTLIQNGDDCDGLASLNYRVLHNLGFPVEDVYMVILAVQGQAEKHTAVLWFEDRNDPWLIDYENKRQGMVRISKAEDVQPMRIFNENKQFVVIPPGIFTPL